MRKTRCCSPKCFIEKLPDDILILILSRLTNSAEMARTSILSRRWINLWVSCMTCLDFDTTTLLPMEHWSSSSEAWYITWVTNVIEARAASKLSSVKQLRICYELDASRRHHIDRWINFAVSNPLETLHLQFRPPNPGLVPTDDQYELSIKFWYNAPSGLSNLRQLKSLHLWCVNVSKQFIEFILLSCPLLDDLSLISAGTFEDLDVSGVPPLQLRRLEIDLVHEFVLTKLCAPYLKSLSIYSSYIFYLHKIDVPMLTDLTIGNRYPGHIISKHFLSCLPQMEKLELDMRWVEWFELEQVPQMVKLKFLKISFHFGTHHAFFRILNFINACPLLETLAFEIIIGDDHREWPRVGKEKMWRYAAIKGCCFKCLRVFEVYGGGDGKMLDQEAVKIIINKAPNLEKLIVCEHYVSTFPHTMPSAPRTMKKLEEKAKALCQRRPLEIVIKNVRQPRVYYNFSANWGWGSSPVIELV